MIIETTAPFASAAQCYISMRKYMFDTGEDFIDQNEFFISGMRLLSWLLVEDYINTQQYDEIRRKEETWIQDLMLGNDTGIMRKARENELACLKSYQLIAEYISQNAEFHTEFLRILQENPDALIITDSDIRTIVPETEPWSDILKSGSIMDEYEYLCCHSIAECDILDNSN